MLEFKRRIIETERLYTHFENILELKKILVEDIQSEISKSFIFHKYELSNKLKKSYWGNPRMDR